MYAGDMRVTNCPHAITDYQYATWYKCRECGAFIERVEAVSGRTERRDIVLPLSLLNYPARPHARGGPGVNE